MKLLVLSSHAILEYDELRLFSDLGYDVFMPGGYSDPSHPSEALRPALPDAPYYPELDALCHEQRVRHIAEDAGYPIIDWAKADLHPDLLDWADVVMVNCFPVEWIGRQWPRLRSKRVVWRTIGQSNPIVEREMRLFVRDGLQVVRYSPAERRAFGPLGVFAGEDAVIRFAKYPSDFAPWIGDECVVGNVTQNLDERGDFTGFGYWQEATAGLPTKPSGLGSERIGGTGPLPYREMLDYLRNLRAYLYMGTQPASYTLGLMEAMLAGVPVVSRGRDGLWMPALFEGHELGLLAASPSDAADMLRMFLDDYKVASEVSFLMRQKAVMEFSADVIGPQWLDFLGAPVPTRELVAA